MHTSCSRSCRICMSVSSQEQFPLALLERHDRLIQPSQAWRSLHIYDALYNVKLVGVGRLTRSC